MSYIRTYDLQYSLNSFLAAAVLLALTLAALWIAGVSEASPLIQTGLFVFVFGFLPAVTFCHTRSCALLGTDFFVYTLVGLVLTATVDACLLYFGLRSNLLLMLLMLPLALFGFMRSITGTSSVSWRFPQDLTTILLCVLFVFQLALSLILMARGPVASVFINVDAPFYLSQTHAIAAETAWPVESLNVSGARIGYHYGVQNAAALLMRFAGLPAHAALFGVVMGFAVMAMATTVAAIARQLQGKHAVWLPLGLILLFTLDVHDAWIHITRLRVPSMPLPHPGGLFSTAAALICLYAIADKEKPNLCLLSLTIFVTSFSRTTDFLALIMGFGLFTLIKFAHERKIIQAIYFFATCTLSFTVIFTITYESSGGSILIRPLSYLFTSDTYLLLKEAAADIFAFDLAKGMEKIIRTLSTNIVVATAILVLTAFGMARRALRLDILAFALPPIIFLNIFVFDHPGFVPIPGEPPRDLSHAFSNMTRANTYFWWGLLAAYIGAHERIRSTLTAKAAYLAMHILVAGAVFVYVLQGFVLVRDHTRFHEFVDNSTIADALTHIPVEGSLLVTNDVRYPAQNYARNNRQHQLSALYGHHNFASVLHYVPTPDAPERRRLNALLAASTWSEELYLAARRYGWTHYIVHKAAPYPVDIPLSLIYENDAYKVYRFPY